MSVEPGPIRVLLIEHNRILLEGLCRLLCESSDVELVGFAASGTEGIEFFTQKLPTVTIVDLELPDTSLAELVLRIRQIDAGAAILILATYELDPTGSEVISSGAAAIVAKDQIASMLLPMVRRVGRRSTRNPGHTPDSSYF
jgi:two-component system, NarL family, invasion response regulator UvrY